MRNRGEVLNSLTVSLQHWEYQSIFQFWAERQRRQQFFFCRISFFPIFHHHISCNSFFNLWLLSLPAVSINLSSFPLMVVPHSFTLFTALHLNSSLTERTGLCESLIFKLFWIFQASIKEHKHHSTSCRHTGLWSLTPEPLLGCWQEVTSPERLEDEIITVFHLYP